MTTKKTRTIACRVPINVYNRVVLYSKDRDMTISDWLKPIIIRAVFPGKKMPCNKGKEKLKEES